MDYKILDRIKSVVAEKKIKQRDFAEGLKISIATANKILNHEEEISFFMLHRISQYLKVNDFWLLKGAGTKYLNEGEQPVDTDLSEVHDLLQKQEERIKALEAENKQLKQNSGVATSTSHLKAVSFVDTKAMTSYAQNYSNSDFIDQLETHYISGSRYLSKNYRIFEVTGEEMNHTIVDSDWAVCEKVEDLSQMRDYYVYILVLDQEVVCRRVLNRVKERGRLRLKCDNKFFRDKEVDVSQVKEVWEVKSISKFSLINPYFQLEDWVKKIEDRLFELEDKVDRGRSF